MHLYQLKTKTPNINRFYSPSYALKINSIAMAIQRIYASNKKNIFQFIYRVFWFQIGITN